MTWRIQCHINKIGPCVLQITLQNNQDICILITVPPLGYLNLQNYRPFLAFCQQCSPIIYTQYSMYSSVSQTMTKFRNTSEVHQSVTEISLWYITRAHISPFSLSFLLLVFFCLFAWPSRKRFHWRWSLILLMFPGRHWNKYHPMIISYFYFNLQCR